MKRFNIRAQILLATMVPVLLIDIILTYVQIEHNISQAEELLKSKGEIIAKQIAGASEFSLFSGNYGHIQSLLDQTIDTNEIVFSTVYERNGLAVAEAIGNSYDISKSAEYIYYRKPILSQSIEGSDVFSPDVETEAGEFRTIGWVHLYVSRDRLKQQKTEIYREGALIFLSTLLLATVLIFFISRRITQPVFTLLDHLKRIETGHLGEVIKPVENNEIGDVQKGFNSMSQALLANRMQLDQKIKTATLDLMNAITDLEYKNREISLARDEAQNANQVKSQFLANISHEIRTPINGIKGFANLLSQTGLDHHQRRYADIIMQSTSDLSNIVNEVLDFSKIESNKVEVIATRFDLYELVESTRDSLFTVASDKQVDLFLVIYSDTPQYVIGDKLRVKQILVNLISNAIKFTDQGFVEITVHMEDESDDQIMLKFKVRDSGIGISKADQKLLFQAFKQIESDTNRRFSGTGLGLVISKNLATLMGGDILLDSVAGFGSLFSLVLPFKPAHQDELASQELEMTGFLLASDGRAMHEIQSLYDRAGCISEGLLISDRMDISEIRTRIKQNLSYIDLIVLDLRHSEYRPDDLFDDDIRQRCRIIVMHYDLLLCDPVAVEGYEFISVINTSKNLRRLLLHDAAEKPLLEGETTAPRIGNTLDTTRVKSVLIVDDNPINLMLASELTQLWGHQPYEAQNAEQAMQLFRVKHFDLILLDIQMPEVDGVKLMKMMRAEKPELKTPIAAITANILETEKQRLLNLGFDVYFRKPIEEHKLEALLNRGEILEDEIDGVPASENSALAIDIDLTYKLSANSPKLVREMLHMLNKELPGYQQQLKQAINDDSGAAIGKVIHKLMGVTCYAGLPRLKAVLEGYENAKMQGTDTLAPFAEQIGDELEMVRVALIDLKNSEFFSSIPGTTGS